MKKILPFLAFALILLSGCSLRNPLKGIWTTTSLTKDGISQPVAESYIGFEIKGSKARVYGCSGVNSYEGTVILKKNSFTANDNFAITRMMGDPLSDEFETSFMNTILNAESYEIKEDKLIIKAPAKKLELTLIKYNEED